MRGEGIAESRRHAQHPPVGVTHLRILDEKVSPEAAAEEPRQPRAVGERGQPLAHLLELRSLVRGSAHSPISEYDAVGR